MVRGRMLRAMRLRAVVVPLVVALSGCSDSNEGGGDGGLSLTGDATTDAPADAFVCPADEVSTGPLLTGVGTATFTGYLICPANDKDSFYVETSTGQNIEVLIESTPTEATVTGTLLNKELTPIMNAAPVTAMPLVSRAYFPNLQGGRLYIDIYGAPPASGIGHYNLTVTVTNPN